MKLIRCVRKYVFVRVGYVSICPDGYRVPYDVYRRRLPFVYKYLGTYWLAHWDKKEDIEEWLKGKEVDDGND